MSTEKLCCFAGHGDAPGELLPVLESEIRRLVENCGVRQFWAGGYGSFDRMAAQAVRTAKQAIPAVELILVLAYLPGPGHLPSVSGYDGTIYPEGLEAVPRRLAIVRRNEWMVEQADYLIAYVTHTWGGAARTLGCARRRERQGHILITNLGEREHR